jgi:hypothetical protein
VALTELADSSAFLDLPAADMPSNPPPDKDAQKAMLAWTIDYVNTTINRLPNFYATRRTEHFEDTPARTTFDHGNVAPLGRGGRSGGVPSISTGQSSYEPIHFTGKSNVTVSYQDGYELRGLKKIDFSNVGANQQGLNTAGEFGPVLSVVIQDAIGSQMIWGHWERGANSVAAVFRYSVPSGQSSYVVVIPRGKPLERNFSAYHGEIAIDPANGAILRITVVADLAPPNQLLKSSIAVEYGSIPIGGTNYICPVKSLALSKTPLYLNENGVPAESSPLLTQLNDVAFTDYHLFRAEARVLTGESVNNQETPSPPK